MSARRGLPTGVQRKHARACPAHPDNQGKAGRCRVKGCSYQVQAGRRGARQTKTFASIDAAVAWKRDMDTAKAEGRLAVGRAPTLQDAADRWHADALSGVALARGRKRFKAGTLMEYRRVLAGVLEDHGATRLDVLGDRLNEIVSELQRRGLAASTVRNTLMPLRAIYRHAVRMKWVAVNPTLGLEVPTGSGRRMRVVDAQTIPQMLAALVAQDRPLWATAFYAGLRRGELMALRWADVDLAAGRIRVDPEQGGFDPRANVTQSPKSKAGARLVPINGLLRDVLLEHKQRAGARPSGLVFARGSLGGATRGHHGDPALPFSDSSTGARAHKAWTDAGMAGVTLHDCRHTFASLMIAAMAARGVFNPKLLQAALGHSSIQVTYDRYGHLFPGQEGELGVMLDEFLEAPAAGPLVAQAWSRLQDALQDAAVEDALPVATEALEQLSSWEDAHAGGGLVPSSATESVAERNRAVTVQRSTDHRDPR